MSRHELTINREWELAVLNGVGLDLTPLQYRLLSLMATAPHRPWSRSTLVERVWDSRVHKDSGTVNSCVAQLRNQLPEGCVKLRPSYGWVLAPDPALMSVTIVYDPDVPTASDETLAHVERAFELALAYVRRARRGATNGD